MGAQIAGHPAAGQAAASVAQQAAAAQNALSQEIVQIPQFTPVYYSVA